MMSCSLELLVPDDRPCGDRPARDIQVSWKESSRPQKKRILLVEDYPPTRDVYRTVLEHGGFEVSTAEDGAEGVRRAREELPDLILMDIGLPVLSGWDAAVQLKDGADTRHIPIIGVSAMTDADAHQHAWNLGFEAYFTKPFLPRQMLSAVREALGLDERP